LLGLPSDCARHLRREPHWYLRHLHYGSAVNSADVALWLGGAGTTVLGAVIAWIGQSRLAQRQRVWASKDLALTREHDRELRDRDIREARFQRLRSERREVYARALDAVEEFVAALRDLRDAGLPEGVEVLSVPDVEQAHPIAARALHCMTTQRRLDSDVILIADPGVRDNFLILSQLLRDAFRESVSGRDGLPPVHAQLKVVLREMRVELVGPSSPPKAGS
jgi:hypothetical protein